MISNVQIFTWIGINSATVRNALIADFLSGGLDGLRDMSSDDIKSTFASYVKRADPPFPVVLSPLQKQRLRGLVLLVKDIVRANQTVGFDNDFTRELFLEEISEAKVVPINVPNKLPTFLMELWVAAFRKADAIDGL